MLDTPYWAQVYTSITSYSLYIPLGNSRIVLGVYGSIGVYRGTRATTRYQVLYLVDADTSRIVQYIAPGSTPYSTGINRTV